MKMTNLILGLFTHGIILGLLHSTYGQKILVPPYLQPGNSPKLRKEQKVVIWQTDSVPGDFKVEWALGSSVESAPKVKSVKISSVKLHVNNETTNLYRATIRRLKFDETYTYRISMGQTVIAENTFTSRTKKPQTKFAVFGDPGAGSMEQAAVAYQIYLQNPHFALVTGDMAYSYGRAMEYRVRFFPFYLSPVANPEKGASLMGSVPFYMLPGNHDIYGADFEKYPDGLAFFYYSDLPRNAPIPQHVVMPEGDQDLIDAFLKNTSPRYPRVSNYSFEYGNVYIACLDANYYANPLDPALIEWLTKDIKKSKADWKIVAFHHPPFSSSHQHYEYQVMRLLSPVIEELGVDLVFNGHIHNYQRTVPLKFEPEKDESGTRFIISDEGSVNGDYNLDQHFDGTTNTRADGIIYIISGAGGAALYEPEISENPELWKNGPPENWVPYTVKLVSDRHSFTMVETDENALLLRQIDMEGNVFDEIKITK
ncbi:metallophosphoesterase family protein [Cyclobacterium jeungdonense]|uniref:Metallophosphoesterase family protein n=1 Tax=Cyclobacterium jeungdonense TaxID=708087 RepID=A0ABT8CBE6_9BACT|nr:metallophosphoesterase family protein [Cyclobacterium jeungdonense]MDN3690129.1 metallophosphoesterase family protein [Cyclobacterium jeungdonense]